MIRSQQEWLSRQVEANGYLLLGRRRGTKLSVERLNVAPDLVDDFQAMATGTLLSLSERTPRQYGPLAQLEADEVFLLELDALPALSPALLSQDDTAALQATTEHHGATELAALVSNPSAAPLVDFDEARRRPFLFYAVVFTDSYAAQPIAFIKKHNPAVSLKPGNFWATASQTVYRIDGDILSFRSDFDLIIDGEQIAALTDHAIERLFVDQDIVAAAVPMMIAGLKSLGSFTLSSQAESSLLRVCARRKLLARRLQKLLSDPDVESLSSQQIMRYLRSLRIPPSTYLQHGELVCTDDTAEGLIDILGAYQHRHGYNDERYRADRRSRVV